MTGAALVLKNQAVSSRHVPAGTGPSGMVATLGHPDVRGVVSEAIVGGLWNILQYEIGHGRGAQLPELIPGLIYITLAPFLGGKRPRASPGAPQASDRTGDRSPRSAAFVAAGSRSDHFDVGAHAGSTGETGIERQQRQVKTLGERDVEAVVEAHVHPQAPRPLE
jgi:hypothetical protein